jgi:hypothetical protein
VAEFLCLGILGALAMASYIASSSYLPLSGISPIFGLLLQASRISNCSMVLLVSNELGMDLDLIVWVC